MAEKEEQKKKITKEGIQSALQVFRYMKPNIGYFIVGMLSLVLGSVAFMIFPEAAGDMTNIAAGKDPKTFPLTINQFGLLFLAVLVLQGVLSYVRTVCFAIVSENGMAGLRADLYNKLLTQRVSFFEETRVGELTSRITADVEQLQSAFSVTLAEFIRQIVILIFGIGFLIYSAPKLSLVMLLTFPFIVVLAMVFGRYIRRLSKERQDALATTSTIVDETFQSFSVVKSFANEWYESIRYSKSVNEIVKISLRFARIRGLFFIFIITILFGGIFFILWMGARYVQQGDMEVGNLFSFILYTGIIGGAIASFGSLYTTLAGAIGATERVQEILNSDSELDLNDSKEKNQIQLKGDIEFKGVQFSYPTRPDIEVLKNISLEVKSGQKIALVGQSGSGKSTIVQLLMRFYDLGSGNILVDGKNIESYGYSAFRQNIGIVPQEVLLFGGTIKENILYGNPEASEEELMTAAKQSNSFEFISKFPEGFETIVGERGIKLSGGQRQRIAIARAILKNPTILLLDEATSSLDAESEKIVQDALNTLMEGRTTIIIAHRLATIKDVDCIYVIDQGHVVEKGTHEELSNKESGVYQNLAKLQFELI